MYAIKWKDGRGFMASEIGEYTFYSSRVGVAERFNKLKYPEQFEIVPVSIVEKAM